MRSFDYIIVGAGPAGCVLANRLSQDPRVDVLLVEAGGRDTNPLIAMPGGFAELLSDPDTAWHYPTRPLGPAQQVEHWVRGKTLGGSSAVNGMIYTRGQRADYDAVERLGNPGWGWDDMLRAFKAIEDNEFGASHVRGAGGPLHVATVGERDPFHEDVISAGTEFGWRRMADVNETDQERIGYAMATVRSGVRVSAADAFLHPIIARPNLTVWVRTNVDRVVIDNCRALGVRGRRNGPTVGALASREVILAAGAIATPKILQLSGIGPAATLRAAGIDVVVDSPNVGSRMREHRAFITQYRLAENVGFNRLLGTAAGRSAALDEYRRSRSGPLATPAADIVGFFKTRPERDRPDAQIQIAPYSLLPPEPGKARQVEPEPGMLCIGFILRPDSEGSVRITTPDPDAPLDIEPNYLATDHDRSTALDIFQTMRRLFATAPLADWIDHETVPGPSVQTDEEILDAWLDIGVCGYHAIGTCAMGPNDDDAVDAQLRARGATNLRVVDASVLPTMVSGNLGGPITALAWRAADLITEHTSNLTSPS